MELKRIYFFELIRHNKIAQLVVFYFRTQRNGRKNIANFVVLRFPIVVVIDTRPRNHRPIVVQLPVKRSHAVGLVAAMSLYPFSHAVSLHNETHIHEIFKIFWRVIIHVHVGFDDFVSDATFLMDFHHIGIDIQIVFGSEGSDGFHFGKCLEPKFAHESRDAFVQYFKRFASMPQSPVMGIAVFQCFGVAPVGCVGRAVNVSACAVVFVYQTGNHLAERFVVPLAPAFHDFRSIFFIPSPMIQALVDFVVSAPQCQGSMISQSLDVVNRFILHVCQKRIVRRIGGAPENKILPD